MPLRVSGTRRTDSFDQDVRAAPDDVVRDAEAARRRLIGNPQAQSLRVHALSGYGKPTIYKFDVRPDRSWQITFELDGDIAVMLRLGTHKQIDRRPR